ncbi:hypothetical protein DAPPUDRAFT_304146 [Daphnia pulex]|uniref:Uncharacterized protein n=1 Tax=Daphnia pulex TaxID=6669 RepID=E9GJJ3_DAPPU|nr:hypothetical protein DAPPUDRAFT_304146 [Daphnia pulex]|eukprot:EFX80490.1 hypothetical protein DAPPUDRAFT_304146 [Daphnia pulex]
MSFIPQKILNLSDQISVYDKMGSAASAVVRRAASSSLLPSSSGAPSVNAHLVKLQECEEECDEAGLLFLLYLLPQVKKTLTRILRTSSIGPWSFTFPEARKRISSKLARVKMAFFKPAVQRVSTMKSSRKPSISARSRLVPVNC